MSEPYWTRSIVPGSALSLWCEDGVAGIGRRRAGGPLDAIVTSPPYNLGIRYRSYRDRRPRGEYLEWIGSLARSAKRSLSRRGSFFLNVGSPPRDPWLAWEIAREVGKELTLQNVIHWVKSIAIDRRFVGRMAAIHRDIAIGHYQPMTSERFVHAAQEYVFHFTRHGDVPLDRLAIGVAYSDASNEERWRREPRSVRCRGNTWFLPYATIRDRKADRPHPATFPPELAEWCVRLHGVDRLRRWADPFVGIGSSAVAAVRIGRPFDGFDIDREYLKEARRRVEHEVRRLGRGGPAVTEGTCLPARPSPIRGPGAAIRASAGA